MRLVLYFAFAFTVAGCERRSCSDISVAGLTVSVKDEETLDAICDAKVTATEGKYSEVLKPSSCRYVGAYERSGSYALTVEAQGYEPQSKQVQVPQGECHVVPTTAEVLLAPAP